MCENGREVGALGRSRVDDVIGLGRIPTAWWTLNCKYNDAYDIHRLNVRAELARRAVDAQEVGLDDVRFDFVRSAPDLAAFMIALRTEMSMRIVMPEILPHTAAEPYMAMARFETGEGGNPHFHGFSIGAGGPRLGRVDADMDREVLGDVAPESGDEDGADAHAQPVSGDEGTGDGPAVVDDQFVDVGLPSPVQGEEGAAEGEEVGVEDID